MPDEFITLRGTVRSGKGDFCYWIGKLSNHYYRKLGVRLFPGTLNVHLISAVYRFPPDRIIRLEAEEYGGDMGVSILPIQFFGKSAFILRTDGDDGKHGDPVEAILEIASDLNLRSSYGLHDGDVIEVPLPK